jgi:hypothetical protein
MKNIIPLPLISLLFFANTISAQTQTKIPQDSLPLVTHNELHKKYAAYTVNSISKITDMQQNITYKVEVQKKTTMIELLYDNQGKLISKEKSQIYYGTEPVKSKPSQSNDGHNHQH